MAAPRTSRRPSASLDHPPSRVRAHERLPHPSRHQFASHDGASSRVASKESSSHQERHSSSQACASAASSRGRGSLASCKAAPAAATIGESAKQKQKPPLLLPALTTGGGIATDTDCVSKVCAAFRAFDVSGDGCIDREEFSRLMWSLDPAFDEKDLSIALDKADLNGDGVISYDEFIQWIFDDTKSLAAVATTAVARTPRALKLSVSTFDGRLCQVVASAKDCVRDLRTRVCCELKIPMAQLPQIHLQTKVGKELLKDDALVSSLPANEHLEVVMDSASVGGLLVVSGEDIFRYRVDTMAVISTLKAAERVLLVVQDASARVIVAVLASNEVEVWDVSGGEALWRAPTTATPWSLTCVDGCICVGTEDGTLCAWEARSGNHLWKVNSSDDSESSVDGVRVLVGLRHLGFVCAGTEGGLILAFRLQTGERVWRARHSRHEVEVTQLVGALEGDSLYSGGSGGTVRAWDAKTGACRWKRSSRESSVVALYFRELYDTLCVAMNGGKVLSLDGRTGEELFQEFVPEARMLCGRRQNMFVCCPQQVMAWDTLNSVKYWEEGLPRPHAARAIAYAEDVEALCVGTSAALRVYDARNGSLRGNVLLKQGVTSIFYVPLP
eukprot:TRINITY_DN10445_c0_g1_i1.p1 TRINITY_DN10445_c0_g1~~TRINITY_DN10445_c0_g1_i1.p1  ORF type:complete len:614 (+),score=99.53 TRINITY_DN10445_c0_g1_i1:92-1933(+)